MPLHALAKQLVGKSFTVLASSSNRVEETRMAKPNYAFAKRQRDLAKKQKKEEKRHRKTGTTPNQPQEVEQSVTGGNKTAP